MYRALLLCFVLSIALDVRAQDPTDYLVQVGVPDSLYSDALEEQRQIWVHLPNGGDMPEGVRYPVMYLLDGGVLLGAMAMIQEFYNFAAIPEMIVVGVSNRTNRTRDLTPTKVESRHGWPVPESGGAETFTRFLAEELIPYIDEMYPTTAYRTLLGHSYAGLFTVNTLVNHKDLFTNYVAMDPSVDWDEGGFLLGALEAIKADDFSGKGLYVSLANELPRFTETLTVDTVVEDTTEFSLSMRSTLKLIDVAESTKDNGLRFSSGYYEKDLHGSVPLISMRDGLLFLFDWWVLQSPSLYNDPATPTQVLVDLVRARTNRLTENLGYPMAMEEELLGMIGFMALDQEQTDKAQAFFELAAEFYPESPGAHDALVEFFELQGQVEEALVHARKSLLLEPTDARQEKVDALAAGR